MQQLRQMLVQQQISHVRPHAGGICFLCLGPLQTPALLGSLLGSPCSCFSSLTCQCWNCESSSAEMGLSVCGRAAGIARHESMACPEWDPCSGSVAGRWQCPEPSLCSCKSDHIPVKSLALITVVKFCYLPLLPFTAAFWVLDNAHWAEHREPQEREAMTMACRGECSSIGLFNE